MDIGKRIKQLRSRADLTQEELASRCELSKGFLSQLENDITQPSLPALQDIVEALGVSMAQFFSENEEEKIVFESSDWFADEKDGAKTTWIIPNAQKNRMEPIILELAPQACSQHIKPNQGEEFGLVLAGQVTLICGKHHQRIKRGASFYLSGESEHYLVNESAAVTKVLWICTPPLF